MNWMDDKDIIDITEKLKGNNGGGSDFNFGGGKMEVYLPTIVLVIILLIWGWSGVRVVEPDQVGVVLTLGKYSYTANPGLHFILPYPIQEMRIESTTKIRRVEIGFRSSGFSSATGIKNKHEALMLTGDENIVSADMVVQYRVKNPKDYIFNVYSQHSTVKKASEAALREVVGKNNIDSILTNKRQQIQDEVTNILDQILKNYKLGVEIVNVQLQDVYPPEEVEQAFFDVASAREDREKLVNQAQGYENDILPKAKGSASAMIQKAMAYKERIIQEAKGETQRFMKVYDAYKLAKNITKTRIYLETMEKIFKGAKKVIVEKDAMSKTLPYLNLNPSELGKRREN